MAVKRASSRQAEANERLAAARTRLKRCEASASEAEQTAEQRSAEESLSLESEVRWVIRFHRWWWCS